MCHTLAALVGLMTLLGLHVAAQDNTTVEVDIPVLAPTTTQPLASTLLSFSIEGDNWPDWAGIDERNNWTYNALMNFAQLTGSPPKIRVGADSEDHTTWSPTVTVNEDSFPPNNSITPYPEATAIVVGNEYYSLSRFLPSGTHMVWGVNFGYNNITNAVNIAKAIVGAFALPETIESGVILERIEVGNEADLYGSNGLRPSDNWTVEDYVPDWESVAGPVVEAADIYSRYGPVTLQGAAFSGTTFTPIEIFDLGILNSTAGSTISTISQHEYEAAFCDGGDFGLISFMNKEYTRNNLTQFEASIAATYERNLTYILGETNSIACHGAPGVSNTAGAALWVIDYTLFAASIAIRELYFHEGIGYKYNFMQPITLYYSTINGSVLDPPESPHIQPPYYGGLVIDTFVGSSGSAEIVELIVADNDTTGFAAFEDNQLVRAAFINLHAWTTNSTGTRPVVHLDFDFVNGTSVPAQATARRLVIQHADDTSNLTWAGQSYEQTADVSPTGELVTEDVDLAAGLDLRATEAVLIDFSYY